MDVHIDRLRLQVSGMSPDMARQFGRLVAERLGAMLATAPPAHGPARLPSLRVSVSSPPSSSMLSLAASTATEISRALAAVATR